jgi:hypothetical protein
MIHNKNGSVSAYGLACGYVQAYVQKLGRAELYREGGIYHVRVILAGFEGQTWTKDFKKQWLSFERLGDARLAFMDFCHRVDVGDFPNIDTQWPSRRWNEDWTDYHDLSGHGKGWPWLTAYALEPLLEG